jgi:type II secretory pathway predicted ATPase ExeA
VSPDYAKRPSSPFNGRLGKASLAPFASHADALTYERFFGLTEKAFCLNADSRFIYDSPAYAATSERLLAAIRRREGLLVLTGQIGAGKTTLCRHVLEALGRNTHSSLVLDPFASREDLLKMLLIDFGVVTIEELTAGPLRQASRTELGYVLSNFLDSLAVDAFAVVMLDEAQNLSLPLIEETRLLSDTFGASGRLQIVFIGQPELHAKLKLPEMRQVDQRVCGYLRLEPMDRDAVAGYIDHRLHVAAGGRRARVLFTPQIVDVLHRRCGGVPRLINRVCDRALQLAYERGAERVEQDVLDTALIEVGSATLSPTWDSIMFAEPAAPRPAATAPLPPVQAEQKSAPNDIENFDNDVDQSGAPNLATPSRDLTPAPTLIADKAPVARTQPPRARGIAPTADAPARRVKQDWPKDVRSGTDIHQPWRLWTRAALALAASVTIIAAIAGALFVRETMRPLALPPSPKAPATAMPGIVAPAASLSDAVGPTAVSSGAAAKYLVAVGVFASRESAGQLVDTLTKSGLAVMQRTIQLRQQPVEQIVLGPFLSHYDAVAELRRLQALGGFDAAKVIDGTRDPAAQ